MTECYTVYVTMAPALRQAGSGPFDLKRMIAFGEFLGRHGVADYEVAWFDRDIASFTFRSFKHASMFESAFSDYLVDSDLRQDAGRHFSGGITQRIRGGTLSFSVARKDLLKLVR